MAYAGTSDVLRHPEISALLASIEASNRGPASVPIGRILRRDGSEIAYHLTWAVRQISAGAEYQETYVRLWLAGALLTLGDRLAVEKYFDQGPDLEFVRHLRNGIAHGNKFHFTPDEPRRPAHFTGPDQRLRGDATTPRGEAITFEITRSLQGKPVLFDFIGPGDVCDLLLYVADRLVRIGNGDPPRPLYSQRP